MEQKALTVSNHGPTAQWQLIQRQCKAFLESGFLPQHVKTPAQAITIAWKGHELGLAPLEAFSSIAVISGKPALSAQLMRSLVFRKFPQARLELITPLDKQHTEATWLAQRPGGKEQFFQFTMKDAEAAGLMKNNVWKQYPMAMLQARASAIACRNVFPDALMGISYTPEELGSNEIIDVDVPAGVGATSPVAQAITEAPAGPTREAGNTIGYEKRREERMSEPATDKQIARLYAIGKNLNLNHEQLTEMAGELFDVEHLTDLTKAQIQEIFKELEGPDAA